MIGHRYLERGEPVTVITRWNSRTPPPATPPWLHWYGTPRGGPRNVAIQRGDHWQVATGDAGRVEVASTGLLTPSEARAMAAALVEIADMAAPCTHPTPPGYRPK